jgi:hypothetical protein
MKAHAWEYMNATASLKNPNVVSFFEDRQNRLYRSVDLDTIGTHGWEAFSVVLIQSEDGGQQLQYFFKRPSRKETSTIYEAADN